MHRACRRFSERRPRWYHFTIQNGSHRKFSACYTTRVCEWLCVLTVLSVQGFFGVPPQYGTCYGCLTKLLVAHVSSPTAEQPVQFLPMVRLSIGVSGNDFPDAWYIFVASQGFCARTHTMAVEVLTSSFANVAARVEMTRRGLNLVSPWYVRAVHKARIIKGVNVGDVKKSWDVLRTVEFLDQNVTRSSSILDIGAYASEILCILYKIGFSNLTGIDLDPRLTWMPHAQSICYLQGDFTNTGFPANSFRAVTAVSVLEHGFCSDKVLAEVSRILMPGGYFIGSI